MVSFWNNISQQLFGTQNSDLSARETTPFLTTPGANLLGSPKRARSTTSSGNAPPPLYDAIVTLPTSPSSSSLGSESLYGGPSTSPFSWSEYRQEAKILAKLSYPVVLAYLLQYSINMASVFSLGHLGPDALAASALATMFATVTGWAVGIGLITALDTLCSQSYTGSCDVHAVGTYLQRGIVAVTAFHFPIMLLWWNSEWLLLALHQDPNIAHLAGTYLRYLMLGCLPNLLFECIKRYLQAQGIMHASTLVLCIVAPLNVLTNYALVWYEPIALGFIGAPLATSLSYWLMFILLVLYTAYVDGYQAWGGWSRQGFRKLGQFMQLGLPGVLMICAEWWAFEFVALIVSYLGNTPLAAQSVIMTTSALSYQIPQGISVASTARIGNLLGAARPRAARLAGAVAIGFAIVMGSCNSFFFVAVSSIWGHVFTDSPVVIELVAMLMKIAAVYQICDGVSAVVGGILRGQGRQKLGALLSLPGYYMIAIPIGLHLAFVQDWGIVGIWTGLCSGVISVCFAQLHFYFRTDWDHEVAKCLKRVGSEGAEYLA
ncbi:mate-domain-containing protein [Dimargaris cristalligena]|uniref:Mate-domain-containing protein n=1 Tax=Dimargaris cristalligena TaxID=215637 RepID=A0A4Q0A100_9FUNG|nr:mate-domain-containing protein [Dimargaris cristalligena]|eukprot:RKP39743.1 mate-domain-containing protein [Dimargaris cristalligena]